jgi:uncharacterized protein YjbI with pentapeptide repeats
MAFLFRPALTNEGLEELLATAGSSAVEEPLGSGNTIPALDSTDESVADAALLKGFLIENFLTTENTEGTSAEETTKDNQSEPEFALQFVGQPTATPKTNDLSNVENDLISTARTFAKHASPSAPKIDATEWTLAETLANHAEWLESHAAIGVKADLRDARLEGIELISANLRYADLQDANLKSTDLLLADLRDACLVRANLQDACLVGANLEGANLEGASLTSAMGLLPRQLAGANLHEASLPTPILEFSALADFERTANTAARLFVITLVSSLICALAIWKTRDIQLLADSSIIPYLHSPAAAAAAPTDQIYLMAPAVLFSVYLWFVYNLQKVWDASLELPAVFPNGRPLGQNAPRIIIGLLRAHFRWMNSDAPSTRTIEKVSSVFLAYWMVPLVLFFFWARYLTLQEIHGSFLQEFIVLAAVGVAFYCTTSVGRPVEMWAVQGKPEEKSFARLKFLKPATVMISLLVLLTFLSAGTVAGVPHGKSRAPQFSSASIRRWAPGILWMAGYDPYAELTEASISSRPPNWNGGDDQLSSIKGANLNGTNFRYAQGYGIFLANAHLFRANFQGAFLSEADMRGADLGQANLKFAILDRAQMNRSNLDRAVLDSANLARADLRGANLSYSSLLNATLLDARMDGASLYASHAENSSLVRGNLEKTDMREAHLNGADLDSADLQGAYLWSTKLAGANLHKAQAAGAIFFDTDLQGADLSGAQFTGTVLNGANLTGANLDGADLRGALQLTANQICSAKSRKGALMDETLQAQVAAQCGGGVAPALAVQPQPNPSIP